MRLVLLFVVTPLALGAGLLAGYLERRGGGKELEPGRGGEAVKVAPPTASPRKSSQPAPAPATEPPTPKKPSIPPPSEETIAAAVRKLEAMILAEDFAGARASAEEVLSRYQQSKEAVRALERLRRAERKAEAFAALIGVLETRELPEKLHSVSLANGQSLIAKSVTETPESYVVDTVLGGKATLERSRVLEVKPLPRATYLAGRWKEIESSVAAMKDPIDLFFFGVRKCFRDGLRREGLGLLERLLAMPSSGQVVALYVRDPQGVALRSWEAAAGRRPLDPLPVEVEADDKASTGGRTVEIVEGRGEIDEEALARARSLIERAEESVREAGGNASKAFDARTLVLSAAKVLYALPGGDPRVRDLNRRAADILDKVMQH